MSAGKKELVRKRTQNDKRRAYVTLHRVMKQLSDGEIGSVTTAETTSHLSHGEEYLDLDQLDHGVRRVAEAKAPLGRVLPRKAVHENTWNKILTQLGALRGATAHADR